MEANPQNTRDIVDTTDALEAVGACRSMKNFLFFMILLGLLLPQGFFWLDRVGLVDKSGCASCGAVPLGCPVQGACPTAPKRSAAVMPVGLLQLTATMDVAKEVEKVTAETAAAVEEAVNAEAQPGDEAAAMPADEVPAEVPAEAQDEKLSLRISCGFVVTTIAVCNFVVIAGTVLYCLTLLMCMKISLTGRLGGMSHITRAFFISLFLMVIVFPWQRVLPGVLIGSVWLPKELLCGGWAKADTVIVWKILFYLRFCGLWFVAVWFLFWAQTRTGKWARATLRRLGVVR